MINYNEFVKDYNNMNITAHEVRRLNSLNSREYREIRNMAIANGDIPKHRHMNTTGAKFYFRKPDGSWTVQKRFANGQNICVGDFLDEATAKMIRDKCISVNWNLNEISDLINEKKIKKVKNYTLINGYWFIQKTVEGKLETFLSIKQDLMSEDDVKKIVEEFRKVNWNIRCKDSVLAQFNIY